MTHRYPAHANFLGFDFGTVHIGTAVGQLVTATAQPLPTISYRRQIIPWPALLALVDTWQARALVVGLPTHIDGQAQWITTQAERFGHTLAQKTKRPVYFEDERLTSCDARAAVFAQQGYRGLRKNDMDSLAAVIILNQWLRRQST